MHKSNIYTIRYIECNNIFDKIGMKKYPWYLQLEESTANTHFDALFHLVWSHHWLKMPYLGHISCFLRWETILLPILQQKTWGSKLGVLLPIISMAVTWHRLRVGALGYVLYQKGIIQGHLVHRYASRRTRPVLQGRVSDCTFTRCKHPNCFPILHVHKHTLRNNFWCFCVHATHWLLC